MKTVHLSGATLKYDDTAAADVTKTDTPYFCNNVLHSLFSDCTTEWKFQMQMEIVLTKVSLKLSFHTKKMQKNMRLACQSYSY